MKKKKREKKMEDGDERMKMGIKKTNERMKLIRKRRK